MKKSIDMTVTVAHFLARIINSARLVRSNNLSIYGNTLHSARCS